MVERVVFAAAETRSFKRAEIIVKKVGRTKVADNTIQRVTLEVGAELAQRRDAPATSADALSRRPAEPPAMAVVECDGGRIRVRKPGQGRGVHFEKDDAQDSQPASGRKKKKGWRETKNACFIHAKSQTYATDPQPEPPACFCDRQHVAKIVAAQALSTAAPDSVEPPEDEQLAEALVESLADEEQDWRPRRVLRTIVASMANSREFGQQMAREAKARRFHEAAKKAFLGDGLPWNWTIQKTHFKDYTAILDFIHPLSYLCETAKALHADSDDDAWSQYLVWMRGCWQGEVQQVLEELEHLQLRIGLPSKETPETDPRSVLAGTLRYLQNNRGRMDYPAYRREGMPVTTAWMESTVKEMNYRVKGTEMYWNDPDGAESIQQVRAAALSEDDRLTRHVQTRRGKPFTRPPKSPKVRC